MPLLTAQKPVAKQLIKCLATPNIYRDSKMYLSGEMGVGKTYIASYVIAHFLPKRCAIVVVPPQIVTKWQTVLSEYAPKAKIKVFKKYSDIKNHTNILTKPNCINLVSNRCFNQLFWTKPSNTSWADVPDYKRKCISNNEIITSNKLKPIFVYDEVHQLKNTKLDRFNQLVKGTKMLGLFLTGTIFNISLGNVGNLIRITHPLLAGDHDFGEYEDDIAGFMRDFWQYISVSLSMHTVKKYNNLKGLNTHVKQSVMPIHSIHIDNEELAYYHLAYDQLVSIGKNRDKAKLMASNYLDYPQKEILAVTKHPKSSYKLRSKSYNYVTMPLIDLKLKDSKKYQYLLHVIDKMDPNHNKNILVYANDSNLIKSLVKDLNSDGHKANTLKTSLPEDKYSEYINMSFRNGTQVFIVNPLDIAVGVDISADALIWYQLLLNMSDMIQAQRRVYRINSKKNSSVYILAYRLTYQTELVKEISNASKYNAAAYGVQQKDPLAKLTGVLLGGFGKKNK